MLKSRPLRPPFSIATISQGKRRNSSPGGGPPSPTFSETTNVSAVNLGEHGPSKIITRSDLKASMQSYENLLNSCSNYQSALLTMSRATAAFADAMESCAGMKGPSYEQGTRLQASAGLHHLMANHWHVLSETLEKQFEKPLRQHLDTYRTITHERSSSYERALREKSHIIRETEMRNMNRKERNLQSFREALGVLQRQVEDLDQLKARHYAEIIEHEEEVWDVVQGKICLVVRSSLDVFDRLTSKASDPVIEPMLQSVPDPFDSYGPTHSEDQIFSILPPLSILAPSSSPGPLTATPQTVTSDVFAIGTSAGWAHGNGTGFFTTDTATEWADAIPSASSSLLRSPTRSSSSRSLSPPQPQHLSSSPPSTNPRRAESKLRSVLSVIDETRTPKPINDAVPSSGAGAADAANSSSGLPRDPSTGWSNFPFGDHHSRSDSQDSTPRHSVSELASSTADVNRTDAQGMQTPESERTAISITS